MAKTKKERAKSPATKEINVKYNLHIGSMIAEFIKNHPEWTQKEIADKIVIGTQGFNHRLNNPSYGSCYDIIEISLLLKKDFISPMLQVIKGKGVYNPVTYTEDDVEDIRRELSHYKELYERSKREIDLLHQVKLGGN